MSTDHLSVVGAFAAGVVSFLSPCVFPLVPGYLSYLAGTTVRETQGNAAARWRVTAHALFFVLGFAIIFTMLGATASVIGAILATHKLLLERAAGVLLVLFGIAMTGLIPIPFLQRERRIHVGHGEPALLRSALIGVAFGAGWSPCIGLTLGPILLLATASSTLAQGVLYLLIYTLGLGMPFLAAGLLVDRASPAVRRLNRYTGSIAMVGGAVVCLTGILILSGRLEQLANYAPWINI